MSAKATPQAGWKDGFLFLGNHLALDFLNTCPVQNGQAMELLPDIPALLRWLHAADLLTAREAAALTERWAGVPQNRRAIEAVRDLRETLRHEVVTWEEGAPVHRSTIEELNRLLAAHPMRTRLKSAAKAVSLEPWFAPQHPDDLLAPLAHAAADLFATVDWRRVRQCSECVLHFYDISKKGTRRWCSMQMCGNRSKVAAYAARRRQL